MDIEKLLEMVKRELPEGMSNSEREDKALSDMMAARLPGEEAKRPSVESILHAMFPYKFVLHVHPPLINGLTCGVNGEAACGELFGDKAVWIDLTKPGFVLARKCNKILNEHAEKTGKYPQIVILQNHGIFVSADTVEEIDKLMEYVVDKIMSRVSEEPRFEVIAAPFDMDSLKEITSTLKALYSGDDKNSTAAALFRTDKLVLSLVSDKELFKPVSKPFSPDHIVNCKDEPLFIESDADIRAEFNAYKAKKGYNPKIVAVRGFGFFALSEDKKNAGRAQALFVDAIKIATYAKSFGGVNPLDEEFTDFILNWEVEAYRSKA
jgi:rhamnose utilization protein RhaD (predicted bifunctional aldolase and dehydrogenase)